MEKMHLFLDFKDFPVIIAPNLGKPQIRAYPKNKYEDMDTFEIEVLVIGMQNHDEDYIFDFLKKRVELKPILRLDSKTKRGIRGDSIVGKITKVNFAPVLSLGDEEIVLNYKYESSRETPIKESIYEKRDKYFIVKIEFPFKNEFKNIIAEKNYLMFDLIQKFPKHDLDNNSIFRSTFNSDKSRIGKLINLKNLTKTNYHSVVLTNQTWEDFTIIHASDLHIAKRNDEVLPILLRGFNKSISKTILSLTDFISGKNRDSVEARFVNPNNNFRLFTILMNRLFERRLIDVIILSGDLIDFCICSDGGDKITSFDIQNTNWTIFYNLVLNLPIKLRDDIEPINIYQGEELLVPLFTTVGNHDYRSYHYDLRWGNLHKIVNVRQLEIIHYHDVIPANPITSLYVNRKAMKGYNQYINPYQNYWIKLGDHLILIMDSGYDSAKDTKDLFMGDPASIGFSDAQMKFMQNVVRHKNSPRGLNIAVFHAPVINPAPFSSLPITLKKQLKKLGIVDLEGFKEENLKKFSEENGRSDFYIEYKHGTISNNWENALKFFQDNNFLVLNGHTHKFFEFRTEPTDEVAELTKTEFFILKKNIRIPVAIYMDDYSIKYKDPDFFNYKLPFHLQTPSLGVGRFQNTDLTGAFRIIKIKNNKLESFRVDFLTNYQKLLY
ncbi:MAG: metallophosphoesterase [Promethearchaeota archaeon]